MQNINQVDKTLLWKCKMYKSAVISGFLYIPIASGNILLKK